MYCPRCGTANTETIKFCRQCGLPLAQVSGFVACGGTGPLVNPPMNQPLPAPVQLPETSEMLALRQKRALTILAMFILPVVLTIIGEEAANAGEIMSVLFLLIPLGVTWAVYHYKTQLRRLQEQQLQQHFAMQNPGFGQMAPPVAMPQPAFQSQLAPPSTNPLSAAGSAPSSVVEEETRRFHSNKQ